MLQKHKHIDAIDIGYTSIKAKGAELIIDSLSGVSIRELKLCGIEHTTISMQHLCELLLHHNTLNSVSVGVISEKEASIFLKELPNLSVLQKIIIEEKDLSERCLSDLIALIKGTTNIIELRVISKRDLSKIQNDINYYCEEHKKIKLAEEETKKVSDNCMDGIIKEIEYNLNAENTLGIRINSSTCQLRSTTRMCLGRF